MEAVISGEHHRPVVDESFTDDIIVHLVLDFMQGPFPCSIPSGIEVIPVAHHADCDVCGAHVSQLHELLIPVGLLLGALTLL